MDSALDSGSSGLGSSPGEILRCGLGHDTVIIVRLSIWSRVVEKPVNANKTKS